jgi:hypothetical protein
MNGENKIINDGTKDLISEIIKSLENILSLKSVPDWFSNPVSVAQEYINYITNTLLQLTSNDKLLDANSIIKAREQRSFLIERSKYIYKILASTELELTCRIVWWLIDILRREQDEEKNS